MNYKEMFNLDSKSIDIKYYVISMINNSDRIENIKNQKQKLTEDINIFEAINGENVDIDNVKEQIIANEFKDNSKSRKREIGCFLSHYYILKLIEQDSNMEGYTVIFEDDFDIISNNFESQLKTTMKNMEEEHDFDILYIDAFSKNNEGESVVDGVCKLTNDKRIFGTQAYIIKNKNIRKLLSATWIIDMPIDNKYEAAIRSNKLTAYAFCPFLTKSIDTSSTIN